MPSADRTRRKLQRYAILRSQGAALHPTGNQLILDRLRSEFAPLLRQLRSAHRAGDAKRIAALEKEKSVLLREEAQMRRALKDAKAVVFNGLGESRFKWEKLYNEWGPAQSDRFAPTAKQRLLDRQRALLPFERGSQKKTLQIDIKKLKKEAALQAGKRAAAERKQARDDARIEVDTYAWGVRLEPYGTPRARVRHVDAEVLKQEVELQRRFDFEENKRRLAADRASREAWHAAREAEMRAQYAEQGARESRYPLWAERSAELKKPPHPEDSAWAYKAILGRERGQQGSWGAKAPRWHLNKRGDWVFEGLRGLGAAKKVRKLSDEEYERRQRKLEKASEAAYKKSDEEWKKLVQKSKHNLNGLGWTPAKHRRELRDILRKDATASLRTLKQAGTCTHSILLFQDAVRAREQDAARRSFKSNRVSPKVAALMKRAERALLSNCRERSSRITDFGAREPLRQRA